MNDWNLWLSSRETRQALAILEQELRELESTVINGSLLLHDSADKIAVDYAHKVGAVEGFGRAIQMIKDLPKEEEVEDVNKIEDFSD